MARASRLHREGRGFESFTAHRIMEETREHQNFHAGLKAFIANEEKLLILQDAEGLWELPGGRVEKRETQKDFKEILARECTEELGKDIQYEVGPVFHSWIRQATEGKDYFILLIGFRCKYERGDIKISKEHQNFRWITEDEVNTLEFENT